MKAFYVFLILFLALFSNAGAVEEYKDNDNTLLKPPVLTFITYNCEPRTYNYVSVANNVGREQIVDAEDKTTIDSNIIMGITGFVTGIFASLLSWLVIKRIRPKVKISNKILLTPSVFKDGKMVPKIKIENSSRYDAFQVDLRGRIFMHGLEKNDPNKPKRFIVNVGSNAPHPYLPSKIKEKNERYSGREFSLRLNKATQKDMAMYIFKLEEGEVPTLIDCLKDNDSNYIEVSVFSSHAFSFTTGMTKCIYKSGDIMEGTFEDHGICIQSMNSNETKHQEINNDSEVNQDENK